MDIDFPKRKQKHGFVCRKFKINSSDTMNPQQISQFPMATHICHSTNTLWATPSASPSQNFGLSMPPGKRNRHAWWSPGFWLSWQKWQETQPAFCWEGKKHAKIVTSGRPWGSEVEGPWYGKMSHGSSASILLHLGPAWSRTSCSEKFYRNMHLPTPLVFKKELVVYILGSKIRQPTLSRIVSTCTFLTVTHGIP